MPIPHGLELSRELIQSIKSLHEVPEAHRLPSSDSQRMRSPRSVLNLPPVHIPPRQVLNLLRREIRTDLFEEGRPDLLLGFLSELLKVKSDVNAGQKGFVECFDSVRGKEQDPTVVLKVAKAVADTFSKRKEIEAARGVTHKTATMAFRSRSRCERCSRNTSA